MASAIQAGTIERFNPALLAGEQAVHNFSASIEINSNRLILVRDKTNASWGRGELITPQEMIRRFRERNPQIKIVGVDMDSLGSHFVYFHIFYILQSAEQ